jgi:hypothetical protein
MRQLNCIYSNQKRVKKIARNQQHGEKMHLQPSSKRISGRSLLAALAALQCLLAAPTFAADQYASVREELIQMGKEDQAVRQKTTFTANDREEMRVVDRKNSARLKEIIAEIGWPSESTVGKAASSSAFFIAQHAAHDRPLMDLAFTHIAAAYKAGTVPGAYYALMYDRLKMFDGEPQKYGTQIQSNEKSCGVYTLEDPAKVDLYRREVGLWESLESYKDKLCGTR